MRILFCVAHWGYLRNFDRVLRRLAEHGQRIHVAADVPDSFGNAPLVEQLAAELPALTYGWMPDREHGPWWFFADDLRHAINYLRFLSPRYAESSSVRELLRPRIRPLVRMLLQGAAALPSLARALSAFLCWLERALPLDRPLVDFLRAASPDLVLITPLVGVSDHQMDIVRAARSLGLRTCTPVNSWDNLSSGARIRFHPDRLIVWNDMQAREAIADHGLAPERVAVTGAQPFDRWFERRPSCDRKDFCRRVGLDPERAYVLYLCSCLMDETDEAILVRRWAHALRTSEDAALRLAGILVRPHPQRMQCWAGQTLGDIENAVLWGANPIADDSRADYYDSMAHAEAVVGISSTAMVEAGVLGKPVLTTLLPELQFNQFGMPSFRYLFEVGGGLLHTAATLDEHLRQLGEAIRAEGPDPRSVAFTKAFARPLGPERAATDVFVETVLEQLRAPAPPPVGPRVPQAVLQRVLYPVVVLADAPRAAGRAIGWSRHRLAILVRRIKMSWHRGQKRVRGLASRRAKAIRLFFAQWSNATVRGLHRGSKRAGRALAMWAHRSRKGWRRQLASSNAALRKRRKRLRKRAAALFRRLGIGKRPGQEKV